MEIKSVCNSEEGKNIQYCPNLITTKIKDFYTTKINHEIKNPLITLKSKLEQFQSDHYKFYSLILKKNPDLDLGNLKNEINLLINKIFNICDIFSKEESIKLENSKIYVKECLENVFSLIKTDIRNDDLENKIRLKFFFTNLSLKEYLYTDERKLKQLIINSFYFFKSFNILGSKIKSVISITEPSIKLSILLRNKTLYKSLNVEKINSFLRIKDSNMCEELILKEILNKDLFHDVDNYSNYFLILIKKLSKILNIDVSLKENDSGIIILIIDIFLEYIINRNQECRDSIAIPLSEQETLKLSLRELCFDKSLMCRNSLLKGKTQQENVSKFKYIPCLKTKNIDTQVKKKVKFDSIVKIREDLKNLTKKTFQLQGTSKFFPEKEGFSHDEKLNKFIIDFNNKDENFYGDEENSGNFMSASKFKTKCKANNSIVECSPNRSFDMNDLSVKKLVFKVLVVDDEITQRQALQRQLKSLHLSKDVIFDIILASDGVEAMYKIMSEINENGHNNPIRCVIIDENMKYLNGSKTLQLISQINFLKDYIKNSYIISLSSHYSPEFEQYVKKCGCNLSVSKPIEKSFLTEIMNNLINEIE